MKRDRDNQQHTVNKSEIICHLEDKPIPRVFIREPKIYSVYGFLRENGYGSWNILEHTQTYLNISLDMTRQYSYDTLYIIHDKWEDIYIIHDKWEYIARNEEYMSRAIRLCNKLSIHFNVEITIIQEFSSQSKSQGDDVRGGANWFD